MDLEKLMNGMKGQMKGQAVMEYLITYGLALFVILIVLAILVAVVLPQLKAPESCQFSQPGYGCSTKQHVIFSTPKAADRVTAIIQLDNQQGRDIVLKGLLCSGEPAGNVQKADISAFDTPVSMAAGSSKSYTLGCVKADGTNVALSAGSSFKGSVAVLYNYQDEVDDAPERMAVASLTGTVQAG